MHSCFHTLLAELGAKHLSMDPMRDTESSMCTSTLGEITMRLDSATSQIQFANLHPRTIPPLHGFMITVVLAVFVLLTSVQV